MLSKYLGTRPKRVSVASEKRGSFGVLSGTIFGEDFSRELSFGCLHLRHKILFIINYTFE